MEAPPEILVTGEQRRSPDIEKKVEKVEKGNPEEGREDNSEKRKVRSNHGEGLHVRQQGREGRRKSETPQLRRKEVQQAAGETGEKEVEMERTQGGSKIKKEDEGLLQRWMEEDDRL